MIGMPMMEKKGEIRVVCGFRPSSKAADYWWCIEWISALRNRVVPRDPERLEIEER